MSITAWRIVHKRHADAAFSGEGAKLLGGRWNPPGWAAVYAADSLSLAMLELIVHLEEAGDIRRFVAIPVTFEAEQVIRWPEEKLPRDWACLPVSPRTQALGKTWLESKQSLVLQVPSSVVKYETNFIFNPAHPDFSTLTIGTPRALQLDPRLSARL